MNVNLRQPQKRKSCGYPKKALDYESYKLYYVNYEIRTRPPFHSRPLRMRLTRNSRSAPTQSAASYARMGTQKVGTS